MKDFEYDRDRESLIVRENSEWERERDSERKTFQEKLSRKRLQRERGSKGERETLTVSVKNFERHWERKTEDRERLKRESLREGEGLLSLTLRD